MTEFPRTSVEGISLPRLLIGSNWVLGYSHRSASADNMIRILVERNLIKEVGKKDVPGKPVQFGTTKDFLQLFRLNSIADLPRLDETESERFELAR